MLKLFRAQRAPLSILMTFMMAAWQIGQPLQAATYYWDTDGSTAGNNTDGTGLGGTGTWDTLTSNWWNTTSLIAWPNLNTDAAVFGYAYTPGASTLNTVTLSGSITANQLSFVRSGYTLTGGTSLTLDGANAGLHANLGESATINSLITGSAGLIKTGGGSIRLGNTGNNYTGATTIANGSLIISDPAALGGTGTVSILTANNTPLNTASIGFGGGSLVLDGTAGGFTFTRNVDFEGRGPIGDRGAAILSLGNNTLSGTLRSAISPLPLSPTATIRNSRINSVNGTLTLSGTVNVGGTSATTFLSFGSVNAAGVGNYSFGGTGTLTGTGSIEKSGAGTLFLNTLASNAGFTGTVRVSGSTTGTQSSVRVTDLLIGGNSVFGGNTVSGDDPSAIDLNGGVLEFRNEGDLNFGALSAGKNVYHRASSTVYTGPGVGGDGINGTTTLGTFRVAANTTATFNSRNGYGVTLGAWTQESSNNNTTITNNMGGTLLFTGDGWNNNDGSARTLTINGNGNTTITGNINTSGAGVKSLAKDNAGTLTINGTGTTLDGSVTITNGEIMIRDFRSLNDNSATINLGGTTNTVGLIIGSGVTPSAAGLDTAKVVNLSGTTGGAHLYANQTGVGPVVFNANFTASGAGAKTLFLGGTSDQINRINGAIIDNSGTNTTAITKLGSTTWALGGTNTFTGAVTVVNGTLQLRANAAASTIITDTVGVTFGNSNVYAGGTLEFVGQASTNNVESLGALTPTSGAGTVKLSPGSSGTASLIFSSLGTVNDSATINITGSDATNTVTLTGQTGLNASPRLFFGGSDFAYGGAGGVMRAPIYGGDAGFVNAAAGAALPAGQDSFSINGTISAQGSQTVDTLKFNGGQTLTLASGATLTVRTGAANSDGAILATGGASTITGGTGISTGGSGSLTVYVNGSGDSLTLASVLTSGTTGGLTKSGAGTLILTQNNALTGTISHNEGTIQLSGSGDLGGGNALTMRQGTVLDLNGVTPTSNINAFNNNGTVTNTSATAVTLTVGGANGTGDSYGIIDQTNGIINVTKLGTGGQNWYGLNTYTGITTIGSTGLVTVDYLADIGQDSGIGRGDATSDATNAASLVFNGSTGGLGYRGDRLNGNLTIGDVSASTNRLFTLAAAATGARLSSTVGLNGAIIWSNTTAIVNNTTANATLTFEGDSAGDNTFNPQLVDSSVGGGVTLSVTKGGTGQWNLGNTNNTYTGATNVGNGILALNANGALPANSPIVLGTTTTSGVLQTSGTFARNLATTPTAGTGTITWGGTTGGGGFAAHSTALTVTLDGGAGLTWGSGGFVGTGGAQALIFNSGSALADVTFTNAIDLGAAVRTITVNDNGNTGADYATLTGVLSGTGGALLKNGSGILRLTGANTYTGTTEVQAGTLVVSSLGSSTGGATSGLGAGGVTMDNTNAIVLGNASTTGGILQYVGAGETSDRKIRLRGTTAGNQIHADGSGPLILTNVAHDTTETGAKTLSLRGTNTAGNMITSALTDNGAGVLSVTVDGGATWILTGTNTFTGNLTSSAGALGIGDAAAVGAGTLVNSNGNIFAYGADRTITNALTLSNNATNGWLGDYSLTFTGANNFAAGANNITTNNSIVAGKALTFQGLTANALTGTRAWTIDGPGETVINGDFTTSTAFGVNITKTGNGTLTFGTNGATSNWNQAGSALDLDRGTLKFTASNAIPTATAANTGLSISPELATTDTATIDLNGTTQTINALTATTDGTVVIDNTSATAATFRFGANDTTVNFGSGTGSYTITDSGVGALSLVKLGNTSTTFSAGLTLSYQGTTRVEGGSLTIASPVNGTSALEVVNSGSTLALTGGMTTPSAVTSVIVENGGTLSLLDGAGNKLTSLTNLQLGSTGGTMTTLNLNVGDSVTAGDNLNTDILSLLTGGTLSLFAGNQITFNLTDAGLNPNQQYVLLDATAIGGGFLGGSPLNIADYILGGTPGGFTSINLTSNSTTNQIILTTGNLITGDLFWRGLAGGGTSDAWNGNLNNWSQDKANTTLATTIPGQGTDVIFAIDTASGAVTTTLEQNFKINSLTFEAGSSTPTSVTIAPGAVSTNRLEIAPQTSTDGIAITTGGPASVTISAPLRTGTAQTWNIVDSGSTLTLSGALLGEADVTKSGAGKVILGAAADPTYNGGQTADFTVTGGNLEITNNGALGTTANSNLVNISLTGGGFYYNNATAGTVANNLTLNGGILSAGGNGQTYSGTVNISGNSFINMADSNGPAANTARNITLSGIVSGSGSLTIDSNNTVSTGNQLGGTLSISNAGSSWNGDLIFNRGTVTINSTASATVLPDDVTFNSFGRLIIAGVDGQTINRASTLNYVAGAVGEFQVDNVTGTQTTGFTINQNGVTTLGSGGTGATMRVALVDTLALLNLTGGVTLGGNSSISVSNNAARVLTISGVINDGGSGYSLAINDDAGAWAQTNGIVRLTALNTFTGNFTLGEGIVEFDTLTNISGGASSLGNGTAITAGSGTLRFIGGTSQATDRPITQNGATIYSANGTGGATITYNGAITAGTNAFTLTGAVGSVGILAGGITQSDDAADATVNGGTWTHQTGTSRVGDDMTVTGTGTILNLNSGLFQVRDDITVTANGVLNLSGTGVLSYGTATLSADASLLINNGGVVNLGANDAIAATDFDRLFIGQSAGGALPGTLNMSTFNLTTSRLILGERFADREGVINGTGTLTVTGGDIDLFEGTINANMASNGTGTFEKFGPDTVTLAGNNSGLAATGTTIVNEGTLVLDYSTSNSVKIRAGSQLSMTGSNLALNGNASAATAQDVASFTIGGGGSNVITLNSGGQDLVLNLNAITRAVNAQDGTIRFNLPSGTQNATNGITTDTLNTIGTGANAILGGWATVNDGSGTFFARNIPNAANGNIGAAVTTPTNAVSSWITGENISDSTGFTGSLGQELTLNSLRFNGAAGSDLSLGAAGLLRLTSGGILVTDNVGGTPSISGGSIDTASFALPVAATSNELIITQDSASTFEIGSNLHLGQNVTKTGAGTLLLSGTNNYTGYTEILNGTLQVSGGNAIGDTSIVTLAASRNSTLELLANETIGRLQGGRRNDNSDYGMVDVGSFTLSINQSANTTYSGRFTGSGTIVMNAGNTGNLNYAGQTSTGLFTGSVVVNGGLFQISGATARLGSASSFTVNNTGNFLIDNNDDTNTTDRISDTAVFTLNSAFGTFSGETRPRGLANRNNDNDNATETYGSLVLNSGASYVSLEASGGSSAQANLIAATAWTRNNSATINVRGRSLGATADAAGRSQFRIAAANDAAMIAANVGGGGVIGGTAKNVSIIPWAIGENLTGGLVDGNMGNTFLSYVDDRGFVPLNLTNEFSTFGTATVGDNVRESLGADLTGIAGTTINALILNNTAFAGLDVTGSGAGQALAVTSGALLFTVTGGVASTAYDTTLSGFDSGITVGGTNEYVIHVVNPSSATTTSTLTATIASPLTSTADITKSGRGTLILNQTNTAGGGTNKTAINEGTLQIGDLDHIGGGTGSLVFAGGTLRLGAGFTDDLSTRTVSFLQGGATLDTNGNNLVLANSIGGAGAGDFTKTGAGDLTLNAAASYGGNTSFTNGTLTLGVNNALPSGTALTLNSGTTAATLDLNGFNQTLGGLTNTTNSGSLTTQVVIDSGNTLTVSGSVLIGANAASSTTLFTATGGGSFVQNQPGGTFQIGGATGGTNTNLATVDFSGLSNFTVDLGNTGIFRLGDNNTNTSGSPTTNSSLTLAGTSNTITTGILGIGDASGQTSTVTLELGGGTNTINADTVYIGSAINGRSSGALVFDGAGGSLTLRGSSGGTSRTDVAMTTSTFNTGAAQTNTFLTAGHSADLRIDTFLMSERTAGAGNVTSTFTFDTGTLDVTNLIMSRRSGAGTGDSTSTVTIGGGTATLGTVDMAASTGSGAGSDAIADLNISGGTVTIGTGSGTAINMANAGTGRTVTSSVNLTGGTVTLTGSIIRTGGAGTENETLTLNGSTLNMSGNSIGSGATNINLAAESGTLQNLGELNGGGSLTKTTAGVLVLDGTNTYTGRTIIDAGKLSISEEAKLGLNPASSTADQLTLNGGTLLTTATLTLDDSNRGITVSNASSIETATGTTATVSSTILGGATITKEGAGTLIFTAVQTGHTGSVIINAGTLGGNGGTGGDLVINSGGTLAPGSSPGQFTVTGSLTVNTGGTIANEIGGATFNAAAAVLAQMNGSGNLTGLIGSVPSDWENYQNGVTLHDHTLVSGTSAAPVFNGTLALLGSYTASYGDVFDLLDWGFAGNITGTPGFDFTAFTLPSGLGFNTDLFASNGIIVIVPEPSRALLLLLGLLGLMARRRR